MPEAISAYINAYARGLKSRLLTKPEIESMLENGRLDAIGETLLKSQYEVEMAEALSRYSGAEAIDDAVSHLRSAQGDVPRRSRAPRRRVHQPLGPDRGEGAAAQSPP
jgi:hypothetical protein